jgi:hypothetical protein
MYPLASSFRFRDMTIGMIVMSKVQTPLPLFPIEVVSTKNTGHFLAKIETDAERILGTFGPKEYDALRMVKLLNGGHLNRVLSRWECLMLRVHFQVPKPSKRRLKNEKLKCLRSWLQRK